MKLRRIRESQGKSREEVEKLSGVPVAIQAKIERGDVAGTKWDTVCRLCYVLNKRPEEILPGFRLPLPPRIRTRPKRKRYTRRAIPVQQPKAADRVSA